MASRTLSKLRSRGTVAEENGSMRIVDLQPLVKLGLVAGVRGRGPLKRLAARAPQ